MALISMKQNWKTNTFMLLHSPITFATETYEVNCIGKQSNYLKIVRHGIKKLFSMFLQIHNKMRIFTYKKKEIFTFKTQIQIQKDFFP
jgi:hypothetical protein